MYEFVYLAEIYKHNRPSFVKADHADDVGFMFGGCFWDGQIKVIGKLCIMCCPQYRCFDLTGFTAPVFSHYLLGLSKHELNI